METMVKLITELNKLQSENEELKNTCLEYDEFKKSMFVCLKEKDELIIKYRDRKAELLKKLETIEQELATKMRLYKLIIKENRLLKSENRNLKGDLSQIRPDPNELENNETKRVEDTNTSNQDLSGKKGRKNPRKAGKKKKVLQTIKQHYSSYTCDVCGKEYNYRQSILYHVHRVHSEKKQKPKKLEYDDNARIEEIEASHKVYKSDFITNNTITQEPGESMGDENVKRGGHPVTAAATTTTLILSFLEIGTIQ
ncbi:zinc finger protein DPF3-like [Belonocnema kinseyi]|uniref:zinc finger protein DPF3-like n=1 Tax=Belonocnema kinseyi TaxID=2817044 RepID=UPI00143DFA55|nr:zinc finger protein DPF3-like [Belonocnema kinseyi]